MPRPRVLVTGAAGFVGRHMKQALLSRGFAVSQLDIWWPQHPLLKGTDLVEFLARDETRYDLVVHCAYHVGGRAAIDGKNDNLIRNLQLDAALFRWAMRTGQRRVLYFSSSAAYPKRVQTQQWTSSLGRELLDEDWIDLDDTEEPDADYGYAKLAGERMARVARECGVPVTVVRPFSGYGEDQSSAYPFPSIIKRASQGDLTVWGPPGQTRDWIHISDVVNGALAVVESGTEEPVNLCTGRGVEMGELACMVSDEAHLFDCFRFPGHRSGVSYDESKPTGVFYRVGDPTRMRQFYTPKVTLEQGIARALRSL